MAGTVTQSAVLVWGLLVLLATGVRTQEVEDETEFTYEEGPHGPMHWGELHEDWRACGTGQQQSPIDLVKKHVQVYPYLGLLRRDYIPANATIINRGHDIMIKWPTGAGTIHINGTQYRLNQCHWHAPAEHTVDGTRHPLEIHLVHESEDKKIAVVGIHYKYGRPDTFLAKLTDIISAFADVQEAEEDLGVVDPMHIKWGSRKYYRYTGSLTTPPCTEGVLWNIVKKVRTVARAQVSTLHVAVHDKYEKNARPIQSAKGRIVKMYTPKRNSL